MKHAIVISRLPQRAQTGDTDIPDEKYELWEALVDLGIEYAFRKTGGGF